MVIDLPLEDIEKYVKEHLYWLPLQKDSQLLQKLNDYLKSISTSRFPTSHLQHVDLLASPLIEEADPLTKERMLAGLKRLHSDRETRIEEVK